jgi:hypothetical protein
LIKRILSRRASQIDNRFDRTLEIDLEIDVSNKSQFQVYSDINRILIEHNFDPTVAGLDRKHVRVLGRFFLAYREDLVREFGTDRHGLAIEDTRQTDVFNDWKGLDRTLNDRGLTLEDGIYAIEPQAFGAPAPSQSVASYIGEFAKGNLVLAIYDRAAFDCFSDAAIFKNPAAKRDSLIGIIRSKDTSTR